MEVAAAGVPFCLELTLRRRARAKTLRRRKNSDGGDDDGQKKRQTHYWISVSGERERGSKNTE